MIAREKTVFILGAGCSANSGYPLGIGLTSQLNSFFSQIPDECRLVKRSVSNTTRIMDEMPGIETLDELSKKIEDNLKNHIGNEQQADEQILDAKIAISAMFVYREEKAKETGLPGYRNLIGKVFGGGQGEKAVAESDCHVLTFNYDRLFEIAFMGYFKTYLPQQFHLYAPDVLNSGFSDYYTGGYREIKITGGRFCFLKLHGSADWWVRRGAGNRGRDELRRYQPAIPMDRDYLQEIEKLLEPTNKNYPHEPLIAFPHERQRANSSNVDFLGDPYLRKIEAHARTVLATANVVKIIGYSFAPIDCQQVISSFLNFIPSSARIVVQNKDIETVHSRLNKVDFARMEQVEFDPTPF
jgi:hypothetical protein